MASSSGSDCLDNAVEPCGNVITAELLFLHIAMPSHLRHLFKRNGRVHHIVKRNGNVRAVSAHSTGNIEATLVHQLEQQRKRANNLMHVRVPAVDGQTVVFQASLYHIAVVAVGMVSRAEVNDDLYTGITHLANNQLLPRPDIVLPLTPLS